MNKLKERGITLVALVVTIIIMLILAGVTIGLITGDNGLFTRTKQAVENYKLKQEKEIKELEKIENMINNVIDEKIEIEYKDKLKLGDKINYRPDTNEEYYKIKKETSGYSEDKNLNREDYEWKVFEINENGTIEIIGVPNENNTEIYLNGAEGYNNGVYLLNDICNKLYSNNKLGATASSINVEDIEEKMNQEGKKAIEEDIIARLRTTDGVGIDFTRKTKTYTDTSVTYYPKI